MGLLERVKGEGDVLGKVKLATQDIGGLADAALSKMDAALDQYKKGCDLPAKFGFSVSKFHVGIGAIPEISGEVIGSVDRMQIDALQQMIEDHQGESLLVTMLNAMVTAKRIYDRVDLKCPKTTLHVKLGLTPSFDVRFGEAAA